MTFHQKLIDNLSVYFKKYWKMDIYPNQDAISCEFITHACIDRNPDFAFDIGTSFGASALSAAFALNGLGKNESLLTMIDLDFGSWDISLNEIQKDLLKEYELEAQKINRVNANFLTLDPTRMIQEGKKYFIFYDIHDIEGQPSLAAKFLNEWLPLIKNGFMGFHDMSLVDESYISPDTDHYLARHFTGKLLSGFKECPVIVDWLNKNHMDFRSVPNTSIIYLTADSNV